MKTFVLMISKSFPDGTPTGFFDKLSSGEKIHTIRGNFPFWEKRILQIQLGMAKLSIRQWEGKPYRSKQKQIMVIGEGHILNKIGYQKIDIGLGGVIKIDNTLMPAVYDEVAKNDGLTNDQFYHWFKLNKNEFTGIIIHFSQFKYKPTHGLAQKQA